MFQFPRFPSPGLCVQPGDDIEDLRLDAGFPHSEIPGLAPVHGYPRLIAVFHVLLRHLSPRHPPYALSSLTLRDAEKLTFFYFYSSAIQLLRFTVYHRRLHPRWRRSSCFLISSRIRLSLTSRFDHPGAQLTFNNCCAPHLDTQTCLHTTARHIAGPLKR